MLNRIGGDGTGSRPDVVVDDSPVATKKEGPRPDKCLAAGLPPFFHMLLLRTS